MTNHDFWMSISDIINEGFTSEGLAKIFCLHSQERILLCSIRKQAFYKAISCIITKCPQNQILGIADKNE